MTDKELYEEIISLLEEYESELLFNPWNKPCPRTKEVIEILKAKLVCKHPAWIFHTYLYKDGKVVGGKSKCEECGISGLDVNWGNLKIASNDEGDN